MKKDENQCVEIFMPYARDYVQTSYGPFPQDIWKLVEEEIIPSYINRLQAAGIVKAIYIYSNELEHVNNLNYKKVKISTRSNYTKKIQNRKKLIDIARHLGLCRFALVNPLFPLISIRTLEAMCAIAKNNTNVSLCTRSLLQDADTSTGASSHFDHGALTVYNKFEEIGKTEPFFNFASLELLNIRKTQDIELIKVIQNMGMHL